MSCPKCFENSLPHVETFSYQIPERGVKCWWIIAEAKQLIRELGLPPTRLNISNMRDWFTRVEIDERHLEHVALGEPAIVLRLTDGAIVLDGNHRMAKAFRAGQETYPTFILEEHQLRPWRTEPYRT